MPAVSPAPLQPLPTSAHSARPPLHACDFPPHLAVQEELFLRFAEFEEKVKEVERAR